MRLTFTTGRVVGLGHVQVAPTVGEAHWSSLSFTALCGRWGDCGLGWEENMLF